MPNEKAAKPRIDLFELLRLERNKYREEGIKYTPEMQGVIIRLNEEVARRLEELLTRGDEECRYDRHPNVWHDKIKEQIDYIADSVRMGRYPLLPFVYTKNDIFSYNGGYHVYLEEIGRRSHAFELAMVFALRTIDLYDLPVFLSFVETNFPTSKEFKQYLTITLVKYDFMFEKKLTHLAGMWMNGQLT